MQNEWREARPLVFENRTFYIMKTMARPIRETPILFGEDARRFLAAMQERRPEPPEVRARRLRNYEYMKKAYELGMAEKRAREEANGGIDPCFRKV